MLSLANIEIFSHYFLCSSFKSKLTRRTAEKNNMKVFVAVLNGDMYRINMECKTKCVFFVSVSLFHRWLFHVYLLLYFQQCNNVGV